MEKHQLKVCYKDSAYWRERFKETFKHSQFVNYPEIEAFLYGMADYYEGELKIADERWKMCEQEHKDCV